MARVGAPIVASIVPTGTVSSSATSMLVSYERAKAESLGYEAFAVRRFGLEPITDLTQPGTSNWFCVHRSMRHLVSRCSAAIARCGLMPCVRGLNPLCR